MSGPPQSWGIVASKQEKNMFSPARGKEMAKADVPRIEARNETEWGILELLYVHRSSHPWKNWHAPLLGFLHCKGYEGTAQRAGRNGKRGRQNRGRDWELFQRVGREGCAGYISVRQKWAWEAEGRAADWVALKLLGTIRRWTSQPVAAAASSVGREESCGKSEAPKVLGRWAMHAEHNKDRVFRNPSPGGREGPSAAAPPE